MIGIMGAIEEEVEVIRGEMSQKEVIRKAGMIFEKGLLRGKEAVVVHSGVGKVNMAACTQIMIDTFGADTLINTGIAGSLDAQIDIGDIVISVDAIQHDVDDTAFGDPIGQVPRMDVLAFPADPGLVARAVEVNERVNPDIHTFTGRVATGDQFIASDEKKKEIVDIFGARCCEMEGAAMAHVAYLNQVKCVIVRAISDKADHSAQMDYPVIKELAIKHIVRLVLGLVEELE